MDAVLLFLKFKANPCAEHEAPLLINKISILVRATPLLVAAVNGHLAIVEKLLACNIPREELAYTRQQCKKYGNSAKELLRQAYFEVCQNEAVETHKNAVKANEQNNYTQANALFNTADDLYLQALKSTKNDEDKHLILYNLATCRDKAGKKQEAIIALTRCISIRQQLANNPIKKQRLQPLIAKAQARLEAIKNAEEPRMHSSFSRLTA
jgi:tetratricopeptide (TPR) repeat protein